MFMTRILFLILLFVFVEVYNPATVSAQSGNTEQLLSDPGVVSYTFRNQFSEDIPGTLDMIKDMGFTKIEFSSLFGKTSTELRELLNERGLEAPSYGVSYDALVDEIDQVIEDALNLGATYVRVAWIPHEPPFDINDARRAIMDFEEAGRVLSEHGLKFNYHNHGYEFRPYEDGTYFDYLIQNSNPDYVNFEMDTFWISHPGHDPVEILKRYPDRFNLVHMKDLRHGIEHNYTGGAPSEYDVPLGTGQVDFEALLRAAQDSAIEYFFIEDETADVVDRVPRSRDYILSLTK
jgi:sugar phosphate isomerase/epimerase